MPGYLTWTHRAAVAALVAACLPVPGQATVLSFTQPVANCQFAGGPAASCSDTGVLSDQYANASTNFIGGFPGASADLYSFTTAFNAWNTANGSAWTLVDGGSLPLSLNANVTVSAGTIGGGVNPIIVSLSNYAPTVGEPALTQLVWTQALVSNYTATSSGILASPIVTLDTYSLSHGSSGSGGAFQTACEAIPGQSPGANNTIAATIGATTTGLAYCDPIYPFQYGQSTGVGPDPFADAPEGPWPDAAFRAIALLSTVTFETNGNGDIIDRVLTVYQGVNYGFTLDVAVAEPATMALLFGPAALLPALRRRRAQG